MKITESKLRRIIREVIAEASGVDDQEAALRSDVSVIKKKIADLESMREKFNLPDETYLAAYLPLERKLDQAREKLDKHRKNSR